jgi:glycosyltransferase involved in cell wall biosynthesis
MNPHRIVLALESSGPGGAEHVLLQLSRELRRAGREVTIATMREGWMTDRARAEKIPIWVVPQRRGLDPLWIPRFARRLRREGIELLHSHEFAMNVYGGAAARLAGIPSVATLHGKSYATEARRRLVAYRWLHRGGMPLVAVSKDLASFLAPRLGLAESELRVVYNGIEVLSEPSCSDRGAARESVRSELGLDADVELVLAVGNLYPVKDHASLCRAVSHRTSLHLAIAGRGPEEASLRRLAAELGCPERIHLLGLRDDVGRLLLAADLFAQSSRSEGLPLAVLEAMGAGAAVVATRVGGIPEAVVDGESGLLVPAGDPEALGAAIGRLIDDPTLRADLAREGRRRVIERFSLAAMADAYGRLYRELAQG